MIEFIYENKHKEHWEDSFAPIHLPNTPGGIKDILYALYKKYTNDPGTVRSSKGYQRLVNWHDMNEGDGIPLSALEKLISEFNLQHIVKDTPEYEMIGGDKMYIWAVNTYNNLKASNQARKNERMHAGIKTNKVKDIDRQTNVPKAPNLVIINNNPKKIGTQPIEFKHPIRESKKRTIIINQEVADDIMFE